MQGLDNLLLDSGDQAIFGSSVYPNSHSHLYEPGVFTQREFEPQIFRVSAHSSISES